MTLIAAGLTAADDLLVGANITAVGMISLSAGGDILQTAGTVSTSGAGGHIDYDAGRTVALSAGTAVSSALGNISIENHASFPAATYVGVDLDNADVTARQLARALAVTPPNIAIWLDKLEARGWVVRTRSSADARMQHLRLTPRARTLVEATQRALLEGEREALGMLSAAEHAMLVELLHKVALGRRRPEPER